QGQRASRDQPFVTPAKLCRLEVSTLGRSGADTTQGSEEQRQANRVSIRYSFAPRADSVFHALLWKRPKADSRAAAFRAQPRGVVHGRRLSLEERGVSNTQQYDETSQRTLLRLLREQWGIEGALNRDKS